MRQEAATISVPQPLPESFSASCLKYPVIKFSSDTSLFNGGLQATVLPKIADVVVSLVNRLRKTVL